MPELPTGVLHGEVFAGKYRIGDVIGAGAMGTVVIAHHLLLDQKVAIKFLTAQASTHPEALARFMREARAAVRIRSEHVVRVLDIAVENDAPYIVMEYLEGCDLAVWMRLRGPLPVDRAIDFILQACEAIHEAHGLDVIHRDIKPPNLFAVQRAGAVETIKVLDFGISKTLGMVPPTQDAAEWKPGSVVTEDRAMIGSPFYMSPEQMESARDVDARTDIWALGVTLFELITGRLPFEGRSPFQVYSRIVLDAPLRLRESSPDVPPELEAVILHCLQRHREKRCRSVAELATALARFGSSQSRISVQRIERSLGTSETAVRDSPATGTPNRQVQSQDTAERTLPSVESVAPSLAAKRVQAKIRSSSRLRALGLVGVLAVATGILTLLPHFFAKASAVTASSLSVATDTALPGREIEQGTANADADSPGLGAMARAAGTTAPLPSFIAPPRSAPLQVTPAPRRSPKGAPPEGGAAPDAPVSSASSAPSARAPLVGATASGMEWTPPEVPR